MWLGVALIGLIALLCFSRMSEPELVQRGAAGTGGCAQWFFILGGAIVGFIVIVWMLSGGG